MVTKQGDELIQLLNKVAFNCKVLIWPEFGTLLGAYRDKSFISFDPDIDLGILREQYSDALEKQLFSIGCVKVRDLVLVNVHTGEEKLLETTFSYKGLSFDLFLSDVISDESRKVYVSYEQFDEINHFYNVKYYTLAYSNTQEKVCINKNKMQYPGNVKQYLESIYGKSFMTPIKGWIPPKYNPVVTFVPNTEFYVKEIAY